MSTPTQDPQITESAFDPAGTRVMGHSLPVGVNRAAPHLTPEQLEEFGREMDALRARVTAEIGQTDADYIRGIIKKQRAIELSGRVLVEFSKFRSAQVAGAMALGIAKILDNMEIGHNIMHGQYDWMNDDALNGRKFEWDNVAPGINWRNSHNNVHHTHTNIHGLDRDIGYGMLRMSEDQQWLPPHKYNLPKAILLMLFFEWGVAFHDLETDRIVTGEFPVEEAKPIAKRIGLKAAKQVAKDYVLFPALAGPYWKRALAANFSANIIRNIWAFNIIFCGHFPDGIEEFTQEETENESRGEWYLRQLLGSGNISGGKLMHTMSGNLSHQIEHHLFPDIPAWRYGDMAVEVRDACERYGLPYNSGPLHYQLYTVFRKIHVLAKRPEGVTKVKSPVAKAAQQLRVARNQRKLAKS